MKKTMFFGRLIRDNAHAKDASPNVASFQLGIEIGSCGSQNEMSQGAGDLV